MTPCIDLALNRTITINVGPNRYDYSISPISARSWNAYFDAIVSSSERKGDQVIEEFDTSRARLALLDSALQEVCGYKTADGSAIEQQPNWKQKLPLKHRLTVADQLMRVSARDPEDLEALTLGVESALLTALWSANSEGALQEYSQLKHNFETPTAEHFRRYQRDLSRSYVVGGSRAGKTIWKGAQKTLAQIYDELIVGVEGYAFNGIPLEGRDSIAQLMDTYHKVTAAAYLFRPVELGAQIEEA
jgi:hypothetical protein